MPELRRRTGVFLGARIPERRLFIQSSTSTTYIRLTPLSQLLMGAAGVLTAGWLSYCTAHVVLNTIQADSREAQAQLLHEAYRGRLEELTAERDQRAAEAYSAQNRFQIAMEQISRQQTAILESVEERRELSTALDLMRTRLHEVAEQRDRVEVENANLLKHFSEVTETLSRSGSTGDDLTETLQAVTAALTDAVRARDEAALEREQLEQQLVELELRMQINTRRQEEMLSHLEQAVEMSFGPLEQMFRASGLDVDSLLATVRRNYSGTGGPDTPVTMSTRSFDDPEVTSRFDELMIDLDRMTLLRIAAGKVPYTMPVMAAHRFTSGFGTRRDPKTGGRRMHSGIDLAAPRGTPIHATADGVVKSARYENGYGNTVRIQHAFGFETVYAHQTRLHVRPGDRVSRGDHIGDMGATGRSTGVHLHYEVHLNGRPVNPMTYLEAAKDVF